MGASDPWAPWKNEVFVLILTRAAIMSTLSGVDTRESWRYCGFRVGVNMVTTWQRLIHAEVRTQSHDGSLRY